MELIYRFDPRKSGDEGRPADSAAAVERLLAGNRRLVKLVEQVQQAAKDGDRAASQSFVLTDFHLGLPGQPGVPHDQVPFALVLGCSDARVPVEWVFDQGFNDLFVVRVAGNVVGSDCIGSFQYATRHLGGSLRTVVVMGHTCCGAVAAAVDAYLSPNDYADIAFSHSLRLLADRIVIVVRGAAEAMKRQFGQDVAKHPEYRTALLEATVYLNAAITAFDLKRELFGQQDRALDVMYGVCNIRSMLVGGRPAAGESELLPAPRGTDELGQLSDRIVEAIASEGLLT